MIEQFKDKGHCREVEWQWNQWCIWSTLFIWVPTTFQVLKIWVHLRKKIKKINQSIFLQLYKKKKKHPIITYNTSLTCDNIRGVLPWRRHLLSPKMSFAEQSNFCIVFGNDRVWRRWAAVSKLDLKDSSPLGSLHRTEPSAAVVPLIHSCRTLHLHAVSELLNHQGKNINNH